MVCGLQVTQYNGKPQLIAKIHKAKECSFCLFDGRPQVRSALLVQPPVRKYSLRNSGAVTLPCMARQHLASGAVQGSNTPYQVSSESYTLEGRDPAIIAALRSFGRLLNNTTLGSTAYMKRIKDIRAGGFFDIICRVCPATGMFKSAANKLIALIRQGLSKLHSLSTRVTDNQRRPRLSPSGPIQGFSVCL